MSETKAIANIADTPWDNLNEFVLPASEEWLKNRIQLANEIGPWKRISAGCKTIDSILLGGIPVNGISEIYGFSGVGKTQFCLQLALNSQLPHQLGGIGKEVIYVCTEDVFPSKRLNQLANACRCRYNIEINFEDHIYIRHITDWFQLEKCLLTQLPKFLETRNIGLIVIDSIAGIFRSENENPNYVSRSHNFNVISKALNNLQDQYNCAVLIVNQVTDNIAAGTSDPCLGLSWANNVTRRFCLSRTYGANPVRTFEVIFAPDLAPKSSNVIISPDGISDAQTK